MPVQWKTSFLRPGFFLGLLGLLASAAVEACLCSGGSCYISYDGRTWAQPLVACSPTSSSTSSASSQWILQQDYARLIADNPSANAVKYDVTKALYVPLSYGEKIKKKDASLDASSVLYSPWYQPPARADQPARGFGVSLGYADTAFSGGTMLAGEVRQSASLSLNLSYAQDYDNWGYLVLVPIKRQDNSRAFSALDSLSLGIAVMPVYHLLHQQVHGVKLDVGAVAGYERVWLDDKAALTAPAGAFAQPSFDDPSSLQLGGTAHLAWQGGGTVLGAGLSHIAVRNLANTAQFGSNSSLTLADISASQAVAAGTFLGLNLSHTRLHQLVGAADADYGNFALSLTQVARRNQWGIRLDQTFGNRDYFSRSIQFSVRRALD